MESPTKENVYASLISNCKGEVRDIKQKVSFISREVSELKEAPIAPVRNELEDGLVTLLSMLKELKNSIVN